MASGGNPIGEIPVLITGDFSDLEKSLQQATSAASSSAASIASAFNSAAGTIDPLTAEIQKVADGFRTGSLAGIQFEQAMQGLYAQGVNLGDVMQVVNASVAAEAQSAQQATISMEAAASAATAEATALASAAQSTENLASANTSAASSLQSFAQQAQQTSAAATQGASEVEKMVTQLLAVAGISLSIGALKSFAETAVETFAEVEKVQIAFTYLSGSAETAAAAMADFKAVSQELALPFDSVTSFSQKLLAAGASLDQLDSVIRATADDAAATGSSFDSIATKIYNLAESTTIPTKSLKTLAITIQELADANGLTVQQLKDQWGSLTIDQKLEEIENGLRKFQGASKDVADSTAGDLERMKNSWTFTLEEVGGTLASVTKGLVPAFQYAGKIIAAIVTDIIDIFKGLGAVAAGVFISLKDNFITLAQVLSAAATGNYAQAFAAATTGFKNFTQEIQSLYADTVAEIKKDQADLENLGTTLSTGGPKKSGVTSGGSPPPGEIPADNSTAITGITALQKEFQRLMDASDKLIDETATDWNTYVENLSHGGKTAEASVKAIQSDIENLQHALKDFAPGGEHDALQDEIDRLVQVRDRMNEIAASEDAAKITQKWNEAIQKIADENDKLSDAFDKLSDKAGMALTKTGSGFAVTTSLGATLVGQVQVIPGAFDRIAGAGNKALADIGNAVSGLKLSTEGLSESEQKNLDLFNQLADTGKASLPLLEAGWNKVHASVNKLASDPDGLPGVVAEYDKIIAQFQRANAPIQDLIKLQQEELQIVISTGIRTGQSVGDQVFQYEKLKIAQQEIAQSATQMSQSQIIALANMNMAVQAHRDAVNLVSDSYKMVQKDVVNAFQGFGQALGKDIADFKSFHQLGLAIFADLTKAIKKFAEQVLSDIVGNLFKTLGEKIVSFGADAVGGLLGIGTSIGKGLLAAPAGAVAASGAEATKLIDSLTGAGTSLTKAGTDLAKSGADLTSSASATTSAAGSVSGAAGSLMGTVGAIGSALGALASVGSFVTSLETNHKLAAIEGNTRISAILDQQSKDDAWSQFNSMYDRIGEILNAVRDVTANIVHLMEGDGNIFARLGDIWGTLQEIAAGITAFAAAIDAMTSAIHDAATSQSQQLTTIDSAIQDLGSVQAKTAESMAQVAGALVGPQPGGGVAGPGGLAAGSTGTNAGRIDTSGGGAGLPLVSQLNSSLQVISQAVQGLATMEGEVASGIKQLIMSQDGVFNAIRAFTSPDSSLASAITDSVAQNAVVAQSMDEIGQGISDFSVSLNDLAAGQNSNAASFTSALSQLNTTTEASQAITQSVISSGFGSLSTTQMQSALAAQQTATTVTGLDTTTKKYMGIAQQASDTSSQILDSTTQLNTTATDISGNTADTTTALGKICDELVYADRMFFLDKLVYLDKLVFLDKLGTIESTTSLIYGVDTAIFVALTGVWDTLKTIAKSFTNATAPLFASTSGTATGSATTGGNPTPIIPIPTTGLSQEAIQSLVDAVRTAMLAIGATQGQIQSAIDALLKRLTQTSIVPTIANASTNSFQPLPTNAIFSASVPGSVANAGATPSIGSVDNSIGSITINVSGAQSPRQTADAIFKELRNRSPKFSQAATRGN